MGPRREVVVRLRAIIKALKARVMFCGFVEGGAADVLQARRPAPGQDCQVQESQAGEQHFGCQLLCGQHAQRGEKERHSDDNTLDVLVERMESLPIISVCTGT